MDSAKLNDWLQVVGLFGVIASLLFVGLQMKQDREIAQSAVFQARTDAVIQNLADISSNPFLMSAMDKQAAGQPLAPSEEFARTTAARMALFNYENVHFQYSSGFVDEERWLAVRENVKGNFSNTFAPFREVYESDPGRWRSSFQKVVDEIIAEIDAETNLGSDPGSDPRREKP